MYVLLKGLSLLLILFTPWSARAESQKPQQSPVIALLAAYPNFLDRLDGNEIVWKDGTRMTVDDGKKGEALESMLDDPDIKDMFIMPYPAGDRWDAPAVDFDPGRIRYMPLFKKMYGDCQTTNLATGLENVTWLPTKFGKPVRFSKINGAAAALHTVSEELDKLSDQFLDYLRPPAGTFNCRPIAGTTQVSAHGLGIAIDIALKYSDYWLWTKPAPKDGTILYKNRIPAEIVQIFEKHGFIWGGKWYHYDTMHFEYRPELLSSSK